MSELVFKMKKKVSDDDVDRAIETNTYITIEDWKIIEDELIFIPLHDEAIKQKTDLNKFSTHITKELGAKFTKVVE